MLKQEKGGLCGWKMGKGDREAGLKNRSGVMSCGASWVLGEDLGFYSKHVMRPLVDF